jgi:transcriptional regulator with XRE-family HTH domain
MQTEITPGQCRAARGLLNLSQADLVERSGVSLRSIAEFERGASKPYGRTLAALISALEAEGVEFIPRGVRLRRGKKTLNDQ